MICLYAVFPQERKADGKAGAKMHVVVRDTTADTLGMEEEIGLMLRRMNWKLDSLMAIRKDHGNTKSR
jgi:hypothetical protein